MTEIPLIVREHAGSARPAELVVGGVPLPDGFVQPGDALSVEGPTGSLPCHTQILARWPNGSVKWLEVAFQASVAAHGSTGYSLVRGDGPSGEPGVRVSASSVSILIDTGAAQFQVPSGGHSLLTVDQIGQRHVDFGSLQGLLQLEARRCVQLQVCSAEVECAGPVLCRVRFEAVFPRTGLRVAGRWTFTAGSALADLEMTLHNPARARHPRGLWDLGDAGSVLFERFAIVAEPVESDGRQIHWREDPGAAWKCCQRLVLCQQSSGGENYDSRNHVDRTGRVPARANGFRTTSDAGRCEGLRATPIGVWSSGDCWMALAIREFWQTFPKAMELGDDVSAELFPRQIDSPHELQGGEQKTHRLGFLFGSGVWNADTLSAIIAPLEFSVEPSWLVQSGAIPRLPASSASLRPQWSEIASSAVEGPHSFFAKREVIDEYGWRNFGDLWADHEQEYYQGEAPIISHYNNQYDALEGFLLCYLLTGDRRWWQLADPLARHVIDIDIYHTSQDRAAYNGGLFWHTNHYRDAATSTHRSYSAVNHPQGGGGPANEHNYTSGLLLYHFLTGNPLAREAVISLADWVLAMDDGRRHILGLVVDGPTGLASQTTETLYHRPGRGAGNSVNALLDGYLLTRRSDYLHKVVELVQRTIHPHDDIPQLDLGHAELRWSYTVLLQSLLRIVLRPHNYTLAPEFVGYCRDCLLHYACWMQENETFYLDHPERLEYPTSTWAAQELRKANVLAGAALLADDVDRQAFLRRADEFYERAWSTLLSSATWHHTRPTVLALQLGLTAACLAEAHANRPVINGHRAASFPPRGDFLPQKETLRRRLRSPVGAAAMVMRGGRFWRWPEVWRSTWAAQRVRNVWRQFVE